MTDEQAHKAHLALIKAHLDQMNKEARIKHHLNSIEAVKLYNLPYRVYLKKEYEDNEVRINPFYPFPAVPLAHKWKKEYSFASTEEYFDYITEPTDQTDELGRVICTINTKKVQELRQAYEEPYRPCNMNTEEGRSNWKKHFVKFLLPYEEEMKKWISFDFFGSTNHTQDEVEGARQYYLSLIAECKANPTEYELQPIYKKIEDYDLYDVGIYYMKSILEDTPKEIEDKEAELANRQHEEGVKLIEASKQHKQDRNITIGG